MLAVITFYVSEVRKYGA